MITISVPPPPASGFVTTDDLDLLIGSLRISEAAQYVQRRYQDNQVLNVYNAYWNKTAILDEDTACRLIGMFWNKYTAAGNPEVFIIDPEYTAIWRTQCIVTNL